MLHRSARFHGLPDPILGTSFELIQPALELSARDADSASDPAARTRSPLLHVVVTSQQQGASDMMPAPAGFGRPTVPPVYIWPQR